MEPTRQVDGQGEVQKLSQVIQIDEGKIQAHLEEVVRSTVEETRNALLDAEADRLCRARRYERSETLFYYQFPREHWRCLRTNNPLERLLRGI